MGTIAELKKANGAYYVDTWGIAALKSGQDKVAEFAFLEALTHESGSAAPPWACKFCVSDKVGTRKQGATAIGPVAYGSGPTRESSTPNCLICVSFTQPSRIRSNST